MSYETVATLISDAALELALVVAAIADPFASTEQNIVQLRQLLKSGGRDLAKRRDWRHLQKEYTFPTVNGTEAYALPADFRSLVPNSGWDRTTHLPVGGPVEAEYWQFRKAVTAGGVIYRNVRIWLGQMWLEPTPTSVEMIAYEYQSTSWLKTAAGAVPTLDAPVAKDDVVYFDPLLVLRRLKRDFRRAKGFDVAGEENDYQEALYAAEAEDSPSSTIYIGGRKSRFHRLDRHNLPDTIT